jgi:hypothetical protein
MAIVDSRWFLKNQQDDAKTSLTLEGGDIDPDTLKARVEGILNVEAVSVKVRNVTLAPVTTKVDVTYRKRNG